MRLFMDRKKLENVHALPQLIENYTQLFAIKKNYFFKNN